MAAPLPRGEPLGAIRQRGALLPCEERKPRLLPGPRAIAGIGVDIADPLLVSKIAGDDAIVGHGRIPDGLSVGANDPDDRGPLPLHVNIHIPQRHGEVDRFPLGVIQIVDHAVPRAEPPIRAKDGERGLLPPREGGGQKAKAKNSPDNGEESCKIDHQRHPWFKSMGEHINILC